MNKLFISFSLAYTMKVFTLHIDIFSNYLRMNLGNTRLLYLTVFLKLGLKVPTLY